jgi:hypothetical protein
MFIDKGYGRYESNTVEDLFPLLREKFGNKDIRIETPRQPYPALEPDTWEWSSSIYLVKGDGYEKTALSDMSKIFAEGTSFASGLNATLNYVKDLPTVYVVLTGTVAPPLGLTFRNR